MPEPAVLIPERALEATGVAAANLDPVIVATLSQGRRIRGGAVVQWGEGVDA